MVGAFFRTALPTFFAIAMVASLLDWSGVLDAAGRLLEPAMAVFALPVEAALPTVLAAVRKDGILLLAEEGTVASLSRGPVAGWPRSSPERCCRAWSPRSRLGANWGCGSRAGSSCDRPGFAVGVAATVGWARGRVRRLTIPVQAAAASA